MRPSGMPGRDCPRCPRLVAFRQSWRQSEPDWFNAPVDSFGPSDARLLIVGLAPGLRGANRTGRPFTGDYAGDLLYATLTEFGFARGHYAASPDDGLQLLDCRITNAVRCVPPDNKPTPQEITTCRDYLKAAIAEMSNLLAVVALGRIAHESFVQTSGARRSQFPFAHGRAHVLTHDLVHDLAPLTLLDSYHCSRYNTNTGVLTPQMFRDVVAQARKLIDARPQGVLEARP
jgi:uracil-DNA glycosylase family 4